ncbi:peptidoglycan DD-metalloendopeptidase family protein [Paraburkholderia adhaesiva]|uniref:peptidoglycan DD-metalloendopeptidase family protein n=1 Tax=Paraburkholderia adhaesiva TaxID=2883244 RepID=UPI001F33FAB9|nr:peptidoglycan DD-metalloendopeptidase family protein [Paraburkholderia adhaesiva]
MMRAPTCGAVRRGFRLGLTTRGAACSVALAAALCGCTFTPWPASSSDASNTASASAKQEQPPLLPTGSASAAAPDADAPAGFYRVKPGDTLYHVATTHGQRVADVASWNKLPDSGLVQVGQLLRVSPPGTDTTSGSAQAQPATASSTSTAATNQSKSRFVWPINGGVNAPFVTGKSRGVVIVGTAGQSVKAAAAGRVVYAGDGIKAYGNLVIIKHDTQLITAYGRNSKLLVHEGATVKQGEVIAQSGTDQAGKASLVFEIREDGKPVDPLPRLPTPRP